MQEEIVKHLENKYQPIGIILHGSRATETAKEKSDWDFLVFVQEQKEGGTETYEGELIDADVVAFPISPEEFIKTHGGIFQVAKVLSDKDKQLEVFLNQVQQIYSTGRKLTSQEKENRKNFLTRRFRRLQDNVNEQLVFFYHLGVFYEKAIQYWFDLKRDRWPLSPARALKVIEEEDPAYYKLIEILVSSASDQEKLDAASQIYEVIIH